jgi:CubicO group peptidase (beta-lactamase class C family)
MTELLEAVRTRHELPAMAAAVVYGGRLTAVEAVGVRKAGADIPVTRDDRFHIGSCTKAMTATVVGLLVQEGRLGWDTTLGDALPDLAGEMHEDFRTVTIRQLLCHRGGVYPNLPNGKGWRDVIQGDTPRQQRRAFALAHLAEPPACRPGSKYLYSNAGYSIVGAVLERLLDRPYEEIMRERLFDPLGMTSAGFGAPGTPGKIDQPWQHRVDKAARLHAIGPGPRSDNPDVLAPGGKVHCSLADWAKFVAQHLPTPLGERQLLEDATLEVLHTAPDGGSYALGWGVHQRGWGGGTVYSHSGSNTMNFAVCWAAPLKDFAVMVVTNQGNGPAPKATDEVAAALVKQYLVRPEGAPDERR